MTMSSDAAPARKSDSTEANSQTAQDYITTQLSLEADAREALPYQFDTCTKLLGPLRQSVYACLTCTPPPASKYQQFTPAGVCYSCSISCHGEHNLVELFTKRDFVCDCGTTRLANSGTPCSLRLDEATGRKGGVRGEEARQGNKYNQNFEGKFCGCGEEYDPDKEKGTMFQCLGLGTVEEGGCGEDWWHPECLMGLPRVRNQDKPKVESNGALEAVKEEDDGNSGLLPVLGEEQHEEPLPTGFPKEDDFDHLICYKCADAFPWIKAYAGTQGFLPAVSADRSAGTSNGLTSGLNGSAKRKAEDETEDAQDSKRAKSEPVSNEIQQSEPRLDVRTAAKTAGIENPEIGNAITAVANPANPDLPRHESLPETAPSGRITLFLKEDFRDHLCRCKDCFPRLSKHSQLLEEEESYEPPVSNSDAAEYGNASATGRSVHSGSIYDRGEAALSSMDRVKAIEGVMAYNHVRDKVKAFLQPFAESGQAVSAEEVKSYFAKLRGDEQAMREAAVGAEGGGVQDDRRREQGGY